MKTIVFIILFSSINFLLDNDYSKDLLIQNYIPIWVKMALEKEGINLTNDELETLSLLDINGDLLMDAIFLKDNSLLLLEKNGVITTIENIQSQSGEILDDYSWVDYYHIDDPLNKDFYPFVESKGQVLVLIKESSGMVLIYYDGLNYKWTSFD